MWMYIMCRSSSLFAFRQERILPLFRFFRLLTQGSQLRRPFCAKTLTLHELALHLLYELPCMLFILGIRMR